MSVPWLDDGTGFSPWDTLVLGGVYVPGRAKLAISGARDIADEKPKGEDGPTQTDNGYLGADVTIVIELWTPRALAEFAVAFGVWTPRKPGELSAPLDIVHPAAMLCNVSKVRIKSWAIPHPERQKILVTLNCREWFPPGASKPTQSGQTAKAGAAGGNAGGNAGQVPPGYVPPEPDPLDQGGNFP